METHYVVMNSNLRDETLYPSGNSYTLHLANPLYYITRVELVQATIPNVLQNISDGTDIISVEGSTFSVPEGFYTTGQLRSELQQTLRNTVGINVAYLQGEGKFLFYRDKLDARGSFTLTPTDRIYKLLGFNDTTARTSVVSASTTAPATFPLYSGHERYDGYEYIKSDVIVNITTDNFLYLDVEEFKTTFLHQGQKVVSNNFNSTGSNNSFGPINLDTNPGETKVFKETIDFSYGIDFDPPMSQISRMTIKWKNTNGDIINLNGLDENSFILRVKCRSMRIPDALPLLSEPEKKELEDYEEDTPRFIGMFGSSLGD